MGKELGAPCRPSAESSALCFWEGRGHLHSTPSFPLLYNFFFFGGHGEQTDQLCYHSYATERRKKGNKKEETPVSARNAF